MKKKVIFVALTSAIALSTNIALSEDIEVEKCVAMKNGRNIIKAYKADCATSTRSCAGQNNANDADSWITVPKGQCAKINKGDFKNISQNIKDKLDLDEN
jgi:uncharacterized membrane protein